MSNNTVTLALDGEVSLGSFAKAMEHFHALIKALASEVTPGAKIEWVIEDLWVGSTVARIRGESTELTVVEPVAEAFLRTGKALAEGLRFPYSQHVEKPAQAIISVINDKIRSVRFETEQDEATVVAHEGTRSPRPTWGAYGAVEGRIQTLSSRASLRFTLFDSLHDRAVSCYLAEGQEDLMRDAWDRRALVEGWITRNAVTGQPQAVRKVRRVTLLPDTSRGSYVRAAGVLKAIPGSPLPEETLRVARDA